MVEYTAELEKQMKPMMIKTVASIFNKNPQLDRMYDFEELLQHSRFLLFEACLEYDETRGARFSSFYWNKIGKKLSTLFLKNRLRSNIVPTTYENDLSETDSFSFYDTCSSKLANPENALIEAIDLNTLRETLDDDDRELYDMNRIEGRSVSEIIQIKENLSSSSCRKRVTFLNICHDQFIRAGSRILQ